MTKFTEEANIWRSFQGNPDHVSARQHEVEMFLKDLKKMGKVSEDLTLMEFVKNYNLRTGEKLEK